MLSRCFAALAVLLVVAAPLAAQQSPPPQPLDSKTIGSWESVTWAAARVVQMCTLVRVNVPAGEPSYGLLVDRRGVLFSVETAAWALPNRPTDAGIAAVTGSARVLSAVPVSPRRANIDITRYPDLLGEFQRTERVEVSILGVTVQLAFDGFGAARAALGTCVQQLGKEPAPAR